MAVGSNSGYYQTPETNQNRHLLVDVYPIMGIAPNIKLSVVRASALPPLPGGDMKKYPALVMQFFTSGQRSC